MMQNLFKYKYFETEINVCLYLEYDLSYRNLEEIMAEQGLNVDHMPMCVISLPPYRGP